MLLSIMYLMVENIRVQTEDDRPEWITARETFRIELGVFACACAFNEQDTEVSRTAHPVGA